MPKLATKWFLAPIVAVLAVCAAVSASEAAWLFYHKPAYEGRVLDAKTEQPIEGAVVVAVYYKQTFGVVEWGTGVIRVKETVTDNNGRFRFPSYTTLINPLAWSLQVCFTIFKPGYASVNNVDLTAAFTNKVPEFPELSEPWNMQLKIMLRPGEVLLPKVTQEKDIGWSGTLLGGAVRDEQIPILRRMLMDERNARGFLKEHPR